MDNDKQINRRDSNSELVFLREAVEDFKNKQTQYDLGHEFAKTKKNRSPLVFISVFAMIVVFIVGGILVTQQINRATENYEFNLGELFIDVNLRELLDGVARLEQQLEQADLRLRQAIDDKENDMLQITREAQQEINLLRGRGLTGADLEQQVNGIINRRDVAINNATVEADAIIATIEQDIISIEDRIAEYDTRQLGRARENEQVLNNQRKIFEEDLARTKQQYEYRVVELVSDYKSQISELEAFQVQFEQELTNLYNPSYARADLLDLLEADIHGNLQLETYREILSREEIISRSQYQEISAQLAELQTLLTRIEAVPYINSIPPTLQQIQSRINRLVTWYEALWIDLSDLVITKNETIASIQDIADSRLDRINYFLYAMGNLASNNRENGYILDPRDSQNIAVYIDPVRKIESGNIGYVFRSDDEPIATISFIAHDDGSTTAQIIRFEEDAELQPFDKILVQVK